MWVFVGYACFWILSCKSSVFFGFHRSGRGSLDFSMDLLLGVPILI
uniref:Uncharacterized protein n=1 Tax=Rhizophora mucronata TaxID=61149 RepID=A0A2P2ISZ3_RHIMU